MNPPRFNPEERALLLELARQSIVEQLRHGRFPAVSGDYVPPGFDQPAACFVTLFEAGNLRGCMGNLEPRWPLYRAVMENARRAATDDPRFPAVTLDELPRLTLEISVLSSPFALETRPVDHLLDQLDPGRHGVILRAAGRVATYLPQVWEKFPGKTAFLDSLARKAGLPSAAWQEPGASLETYTVEHFSESEP